MERGGGGGREGETDRVGQRDSVDGPAQPGDLPSTTTRAFLTARILDRALLSRPPLWSTRPTRPPRSPRQPLRNLSSFAGHKTRADARTQARTHARMQAHTHAPARAHTHTHTRTDPLHIRAHANLSAHPHPPSHLPTHIHSATQPGSRCHPAGRRNRSRPTRRRWSCTGPRSPSAAEGPARLSHRRSN